MIDEDEEGDRILEEWLQAVQEGDDIIEAKLEEEDRIKALAWQEEQQFLVRRKISWAPELRQVKLFSSEAPVRIDRPSSNKMSCSRPPVKSFTECEPDGENISISEERLKECMEEKWFLRKAYRKEEAEYLAWDHPFPDDIYDPGNLVPFASIRNIRHNLNRKIFESSSIYT